MKFNLENFTYFAISKQETYTFVDNRSVIASGDSNFDIDQDYDLRKM